MGPCPLFGGCPLLGSFCQKALFVCCEYRNIHTLSLQITMVSLGAAVATMCPWLQIFKDLLIHYVLHPFIQAEAMKCHNTCIEKY